MSILGFPQEVIDAAREATGFDYYSNPSLRARILAGEYDDTPTIHRTVRAILAERDRCASIAETFGHGKPTAMQLGIAHRIRGGLPPAVSQRLAPNSVAINPAEPCNVAIPVERDR